MEHLVTFVTFFQTFISFGVDVAKGFQLFDSEDYVIQIFFQDLV